jgi:mono/diheme cytochrome c family protein
MRSIRSHPVLAAGLGFLFTMILAQPVASQPATAADDAGKRVFKDACAGCHKWHGAGGGGYGGAALSLRQSQLTHDQLVETIACGRPSTGMPFHKRGAYEDGSCFGLKKADLGKDMPPEANRFLRPPEVEAVVAYVTQHVQGKGAPNLVECREFWGEQSRACNDYKDEQAGAGQKTGG